MKRLIASGTALAAIVATIVVTAGTGGGAAPASPPRSSQQLAQHILKTRARMYLTAPALAAMTIAATGRASLATSAPIGFGDVGDSAGGAAGAAAKPHGGFSNVRVNDPSADTHQTDQTTQSETTIAVSGSHVVVGFNDSQQGLLALTPGADLTGYAYSSDGGSTWTDGGTIPNLTGLVNLGDPWLAAGGGGTMYYSTLALDGARGNLFVNVARSADGGATWGKPVLVSPSSRFGYSGDKPALVSGPLPGGSSHSVLYDTWDDFFCDRTNCYTGLPVSRSIDGGKTWQVTYADRFLLPLDTCSFQQYIGAQPLIDPANGTLYVAAEKISVDDPKCKGGAVKFSESLFVSTDGGQSFDAGRTIGKVTPATEFGALKLGRGKYMRTIEFPVLALDGHTLYAAWNDGRSAPHSHIILFRSTDGGATWTHHMATSGDGDELQPAISADSAGIHLLYYRRGSGNKLTVDMATTTDGTSFSRAQVSDRSFPGVLNVPNFDPLIAWGYMGDYVANVSVAGHLYLAWGDNRDVVKNFLYPSGRHDPDVFFAKR